MRPGDDDLYELYDVMEPEVDYYEKGPVDGDKN
jgi:hypothetical protein